jgi:hypothetical protein
MTGKTGEDLGADLAVLYQTGEQLIPHLADQFGHARSQIDPVGNDSDAWRRDSTLGIGETGCYSTFNSYVDAIAAHLKTTETNLDDTGKALCYAATDYASTDGAAKAAFDAHKKDVVSDG